MNTTYRLATAPKFAGMMSFDCVDCGHEDLGHPVFLTGPAGTAPYGTGCAAKLLGLEVAELVRTITAEQLATDTLATQVFSDIRLTRPGRITAKYTAWLESRVFGPKGPEAVALAVAAWKAGVR